MNLPKPPPAYSEQDQGAVRQAILQADAQNRKVGQDIDAKGARLFLYDGDGQRYLVSVSTAGVLSATAA